MEARFRRGQRVRNPSKGLTGEIVSTDAPPEGVGHISASNTTYTVRWDGDSCNETVICPKELELE